jgi:UDP-N-acetylglucosamine 2-epimerase (non-hydrolysing)
MKIALILGTRPEIIKLSPVIRACQQAEHDIVLIHTNQHFSPEMDAVFFQELALPTPRYNLQASAVSGQGAMVGYMLTKLEPVLLTEKPDWVLIQGDTNTVLAAALSAAKLGIPIGHVEAGLRSYDRSMPEEINRIVTDHLATRLFCPTPESAAIVRGEGIVSEQILVTGNTIVDAVAENLVLAQQAAVPTLPNRYLLLTLHRPSNVDRPEVLLPLLTALTHEAATMGIPIMFPIHPRTQATLAVSQALSPSPYLKIIPPVSYLTMLRLEQHAELILTDSGGLQEEACILHTPCVTLRENTERPETISVGANRLYGGISGLSDALASALASPRDWKIPFGEPGVAERIIQALAG